MANVCDNCLDAAHDEGFDADREEASQLMVAMGADVADHICERVESGAQCDCACISLRSD